MKPAAALCALFVLALLPVVHAAPAELTVRLYNYANAPEATLNRAVTVAKKIFADSGIPTHWVDCRTRADQPAVEPLCEARRSPAILQIRILSRRMGELAGLPKDVAGFAMPTGPRGFGHIANVLYGRLTRMAADTRFPLGTLLGHIMAHEAGHLLLGHNSHSSKGLMRIRWSEGDLASAAIGALRFKRAEQARLRRNVRDRFEAVYGRIAQMDPLVGSSVGL